MKCESCGAIFESGEFERAMLERLSPVVGGRAEPLAVPTVCPDCRRRRRLCYRNERRLYRRPCSFSGRSLVSIFAPESPLVVYDNDVWWSESWDPCAFGRAFDFQRPFFEQFAELYRDVPHAARVASNNQNSDYVNYALNCKDCYLLLGWGENCEHCLYGKLVVGCRDCLDTTQTVNCELCYESIDLEACYHLFFSQSCKGCADSWYLRNCVGVHDCFGCVNLVNARYCIFNHQFSPGAYEAELAKLRTSMLEPGGRRDLERRFAELCASAPQKFMQGVNIEECSGDYLRNCRNVFESFDTTDSEDGIFLTDCMETRDCADLSVAGRNDTELCYECVNFTGSRCHFTALVWLSHSLLYCQECFHGAHDCFGCVGLVKRDHCIFNTAYTRHEYDVLSRRIVAHMRETGEWGQFFPEQLSPFAYNESMAQEYFPLTREAVALRGLRWRDPGDAPPTGAPSTFPEDPADYDETLPSKTFLCELSGRPFRMVSEEVAFYRRELLPLPRLHPDERHRQRFLLRNPRRLWERSCGSCGTSVCTSFAPDRPETILCERCYLREVY